MTARNFIAVGGLRFLAAIGQLAGTLYLTARLPLSELGVYALFTICLGYATQFAGFGFNAYLVREVARGPRERWSWFLWQHWLFLAFSVSVVALMATTAAGFQLMAGESTGIFCVLVALGALNNQLENFMVAISRPISSTVNQLLRSAWVLPLLFWGGPGELSVIDVYLALALAEALAGSLMLLRLWQIGVLPKGSLRVDGGWVRNGVVTGGRYTILSLSLLISITVQRVVLGTSHGEYAVGVFQFYYWIVSFPQSLIESTMYAIITPAIIAKNATRPEKARRPPERERFVLLLGGGALSLVGVFIMLPYAAQVIGRSELLEERHLFPFMGVYALAYAGYRIFFHQHYAQGGDRFLMWAHLLGAAGAVILSCLLIPVYGLLGAAISMALTAVILLLLFCMPYLRKRRYTYETIV